MKEVNEIIGELQVMLKPKIQRPRHNKENMSVAIQPQPHQNFKECMKDLWKTEFYSDTFSLNSFKYGYDEESSEYKEEIEANISQMSNGEDWSVKRETPDQGFFDHRSEITVLEDRTNH